MTKNVWLFGSLSHKGMSFPYLSTPVFTALSARVQSPYRDVLETKHRPPGFDHTERVEDICQVQARATFSKMLGQNM